MDYRDIVKELTDTDIVYLDADYFDTSTSEDCDATPYTVDLWEDIWNVLIDPFIKKHNLDFHDSDLAVNYVAKDKETGKYYVNWYSSKEIKDNDTGNYYISWYNPDGVITYFDDMVKGYLPAQFVLYIKNPSKAKLFDETFLESKESMNFLKNK